MNQKGVVLLRVILGLIIIKVIFTYFFTAATVILSMVAACILIPVLFSIAKPLLKLWFNLNLISRILYPKRRIIKRNKWF